MYIRNLDPNLQLSSHLFPDYYTQNDKVMSPNVILELLILSEYDKPLHPYMVVCREDYIGTILQAELFANENAMLVYYHQCQPSKTKTYFYCHREEFMNWILWSLTPQLPADLISLASTSGIKLRIFRRILQDIDSLLAKKSFYANNFVNSHYAFYHIVELMALYDYGDTNVWQTVYDFAGYVLANIEKIQYIDKEHHTKKLTAILNYLTSKV